MTKCGKRGERKLSPASQATPPPSKRRRAKEDAAPAASSAVEEAPAPPAAAATTTSYLQLRSRSVVFVDRRARLVGLAPEASPATAEAEEEISRCSSNAAGSGVIREKSTRSCGESDRARSETMPTSGLRGEEGDLESTAEMRSSRQTTAATRVTPTEAEINQLFSAAEQDDKRRFTKKYNFDFVNEAPLEGRYDWSRI